MIDFIFKVFITIFMIIIVLVLGDSNEMKGGKESEKKLLNSNLNETKDCDNKKTSKIIPFAGQETYVFDGANLIHNYINKYNVSFEEASKQVNKRIKATGLNWRLVSKVNLSKIFDKFDFAEGSNQVTKEHYLQGRDDFLAWLIAKQYSNVFIVSNDKFADLTDFSKIPKFEHKYYEKGKLKEQKTIKPYVDYTMILEPNNSNRVLFEFSEKKGIELGGKYPKLLL